MTRWRGLMRRLARQAELLRRDPEAFGRNLLQFTNRPLFHQRLLDVLHPTPMHVRFNDTPAPTRVNLLDTAWTRSGMTGGPNTALHLALRVARHGFDLRLVGTVGTDLVDPAWLTHHAASLLGAAPPPVEVATAGDPGQPLDVTPNDVFIATHWTTALQLKPVLPRLRERRFFYMLQEFEAGFYAWSSNYARVIETYGMDFWPVINQSLLAEFLLSQTLGRLAEPEMHDRAIVFEPAVDTKLFSPPVGAAPARRKRLLFYARPTNSRNMFGLGLLALRQVARDPLFADWEFRAIGGRGSVPSLELGGGHRLEPAPWVEYAGYPDMLRNADVLLCPMLSPHTSYPVLEMAACGGLSVTNCFATKTTSRLQAISPHILAGEATVADFAANLLVAATQVNAGRDREASVTLSRDWAEVLEPAAARIAEILRGA